MSTEQPTPSTAHDQHTSVLAKCHCGRVQIQLPKPERLNECHCTVCYKYGALWAYFLSNEVKIDVADDITLTAYVRSDSDGDISFNRCGHCGCMVLWRGVGEFSGPERRMGVNCRMLPENDIKGVYKKVSAGPTKKCD